MRSHGTHALGSTGCDKATLTRYPRTIDNGAGERLTFLGIGSDERGEYLEVTNSVSPGSGPPMHAHRLQEEVISVQRGTMAWQRPGEAPHIARAGESAAFALGEFHRFWNAGGDELVATGYVRPPDNLEYFLTQMYASMRTNAGRRPRLFDAAFLLSRYRNEFAMAGAPALVQRAVFPVVALLGRLFGLGRRFTDAPPPVSRAPSAN